MVTINPYPEFSLDLAVVSALAVGLMFTNFKK